MDRIILRDLKIKTVVGVFPEERLRTQELAFNVELVCDLSRAGKSDELDDSVDYLQVEAAIAELVQGSQFYVVEKLAEETAAACLAFPLVKSVTVRIEKPGVLKYGKSVAIEIERHR